jgi:hypothetical protein
MAIVRGISVDLDGCFMNYSYIELRKNNFHSRNNIIDANLELLNSIGQSNQKYKSTHVFIGSNRQSIGDDKTNAYSTQNGSGFPRALYIANYLEAPLDKFLLTDAYNDLPDGETYEQALLFLDKQNHDYKQEDCKGIKFCDWLHDESKLTILYAQIHKLASENIGDDVEFYFYEDREDILINLQNFFINHQTLLPANVTLNLIKYAGPTDKNGNKVEPLINAYPPLHGAGTIDTNFKNTVKEMAAECFQSQRFQDRCPANQWGQIIKSYEEAKAANFIVTEALNCALDYKPVQMPPPARLNWINASSQRGSRITNRKDINVSKTKKEPRHYDSEPDLNKEITLTPSERSQSTRTIPPQTLNISRPQSAFWTAPPNPREKPQPEFQFGKHRADEAEEDEKVTQTQSPCQ